MIDKNKISVETSNEDDTFFIIRILLPELELRTPLLFTLEHAEKLKTDIINLFNYCPNCDKHLNIKE
ncbi:MAG: hypothetical protein ACKO7N_02095 [Candidatus Nitrosotenuis sp.]